MFASCPIKGRVHTRGFLVFHSNFHASLSVNFSIMASENCPCLLQNEWEVGPSTNSTIVPDIGSDDKFAAFVAEVTPMCTGNVVPWRYGAVDYQTLADVRRGL